MSLDRDDDVIPPGEDRRGSNGTPASGRRTNDRLVPVLVGMLLAFMAISAVATTVALLNRADIANQDEQRTYSRAVICSLEKAVVDAGAKTINGELYGLQPTPQRVEAAQKYREEVSALATREARSLGVFGFPGLTPDGQIDCKAFLAATD